MTADFIDDDERIAVVDGELAFILRTCQPELEDRLAPLFRQAWGMLPTVATSEIGRYWRDSDRPSERIVIKDLGFSLAREPILAVTLMQGQRIEFDSRPVKLLPDNLLVGLIIHELAHVYANAIGDEHHKIDYQNEEEQDRAEPVVDALLADWGLDDFGEETDQLIAANRDAWMTRLTESD